MEHFPYPYEEADGYIYCFHTDELYAYDTSLLEGYTVYDGLVSRFDLPEEERMTNFRSAENVLPLGNHTYGVLRLHSVELAKMCYEVGDRNGCCLIRSRRRCPSLLKQMKLLPSLATGVWKISSTMFVRLRGTV